MPNLASSPSDNFYNYGDVVRRANPLDPPLVLDKFYVRPS